MTRAGHSVEPVATTGPQTAAALARDCIADGADLILVAGGDGTLNEVVNGMVHSNVPVGIIPGGTANVLATELKIGRRLERAVDMVSSAAAERISVGLLRPEGGEPRYFALMAGAGLDALLVYRVSARLKSALGKGAYWVAGFTYGIRRLPEFQVEVGGAKHRASLALATRVRNYGGDLYIARDVTLLDHDFEVVLFRGVNPLLYVKYLAAVLIGRAHGLKGVTMLRTDRLRISSPEDRRVYVQLDGEYAGTLPVTIEIVPRALTMLLPPGFRKPAPESDPTWTTSHIR